MKRPPPSSARRVLVVKLGALGDFVLALGPFAAIRAAHPSAHVTLLTTAPFAALARASPSFDAVWIDRRPAWFDLAGWIGLRRRLRAGRFDFVYDLQTSDRSGWYYRLLGPRGRPGWSGIAEGCTHPHANPGRDALHTLDRQADQLAGCGIAAVPPPALEWIDADIAGFDLPARYALLVPGGSAHRPDKRWPEQHYGELARQLAARGIAPLIVGGPAERDLAARIAALGGAGRNLAGATELAQLAAIARGAVGAVGNDTGPMHLIAAVGCPSVVLFSAASDPALCAPRGAHVTVLRCDPLDRLDVAKVAAALTLR